MKQLRHIVTLVALTLGWCASLWAQQQPTTLKEVTSTEGREFFVGWLLNGESALTPAPDPNLKLNLYISSREDNTIIVETVGGSTTYNVAAGQTDTVHIEPTVVYVDKGSDQTEKVQSKGVRVYSADNKVFTLLASNKNGITQDGTASFDATQIIPVEGLGAEYIIHTHDVDRFANQFMIVATEDNTEVNIQLSADSKTFEATGTYPTITLNAKQVYLVTTSKPNADFSGTTICATKPVAVFNGSTSVLIPNQNGMTDDHAYEQALPITMWGKHFVVPMTANNTSANMLEILSQQAGTTVNISGHTVQSQKTLGFGEPWRIELNTINCPSGVVYLEATEPIAVYLYTTSAGRNSYTHPTTGEYRLQGDPSSTLIPPVEHFTDTTIFFTYKNPDEDANLTPYVGMWARSSALNTIQMDGNSIASHFSPVPGHTQYAYARFEVSEGTHVVTAKDKVFTGYTYSLDDGQASLYTIGYDFTPHQDSLFVLDNDSAYMVRTSEWKRDYVSETEGGWYLNRVLQDDGTYLLDTITVCDSTELTFPVKTYSTWEKVIWEIEGSIQGTGYFDPVEQLSEGVARPELQHKFTLLPIEQNSEPAEDFEVRAIVFHKPIICDLPEDKWEKDTFSTVVHALRQYNDTIWKAICMGDTVHFFKDTVWKVNPATITGKPVKDQDYILQETVFNDTTNNEEKGLYQYGLGALTITRQYISAGGCDSLSTLKLFVCSTDSVHIDTVVCQNDTKDLDFGDFFLNYKRNNSWPKGENTLKDVLFATSCMQDPDWEEFAPHCPNFKGCDSILELHLTVMEVKRHPTTVNQCLSIGDTYEWREEGSDRLIATFTVGSESIEADKQYTFRDTVKYVNCENCPEGGCDSVINTLRLTFVSDDGQQHTLHVCQGKTYTYTNMSDSYTFNSQGKLCNTPYVYNLKVHVKGVVDGQVVDLCTFNDELTFIVDTVYQNQLTIDTVCIDPEAVAQGLQTYNWEGHSKFSDIPITGPGYFTYLDTLKTEKCGAAGGCDSICVLKLRVAPPHQTPTNTEICDNSSFLWEDTLFYGVNYTGTLPAISKQVTEGVYTSRKDSFSRYGCDSILTLRLTVWPTYIAERKDTFVCANEPYNFYGTTYNTPQNPWVAGNSYELKHTVASVHGCDSMVLHNVTVHPIYLNEREENDTVCQVLTGPAYYEWEGADHAYWNSQQLQSLNTAGTFELVDYMETVEHCDSIIHRTLVIMPTYYQPTTWTMSSEGTYIWDNRIYAGMEAEVENPLGLEVVRCTGVMTFTDSLHTDSIGTHSCDSVRTLTLRIGQVFRDTMYDATCVNCGTYEWVITSPITGEDTTIYITELPQAYDTLIYYDSLLTAMQFDSIYVLYLTAYPTHYQTTQDEVCQGEPYIWTDHEPTAGNIPHHLYLNGVEIQEIPTDQHGTIQIVDSMRTLEVYTNPMTGETKQMNCDSVWMLTLTIHPTYNDRYVNLTDLRSMSSNDTISHFTQPHTLFVGYDFDYNAAGTSKAELEAQYERVVYMYSTGEEIWMDSVINNSVQGCDSVHYVRIAICQMKFTAYTDSIADNDSTWFFGGETANRDHTLPLVTGERFHYYDDGTPVKYDSATNRPMREYFFIDTLRTANGCDSIVHLTLHVFPSYRFEFDTAICSNTRYDWRVYDYLNRGRTGYVYDSVNYQIGTHTFDSVYVLGLDVVPSGFWQYDTILCMNDTITWHYQTIFYRPGGLKYIEAEYKEEGSMCGDIYRLNLTFKPYYSTSLVEYDTICQLDDYHWISPDETIEHTAALRDAWGQPITKIPTDVTGDFVYYDSLHTAECGCDSTYTLMLHIKPSYHFYDTLFTLCSSDTLDWHDRRYYYQGEADVFDTVFDISTVYQCDSNYYLRVHFDLSYEITDSLFLCSDLEHFTWQDIVFDDTLAASHYWDAPRDYYFTRKYQTTISHCDSVHHLKLRIAPSYDSIWTDTLCRGETYTLFNQRLTQPGQYTDVQPNRFGCNTYYYLTLVEVPSPVFTLHVEPICVDESGMANNYLLHYSYTGNDAPISYSIRYGEEARSMGFVDEADIPIAPGETTLYLHVPNFSSRDQYPRPNTYDAIISFENGICLSDSLMTYPFTMEMRYPSWITTQHWNDAIFIMDSTLNGGYSFASYQWYRNDTLLHGETRPYLYEPQYLHAGATYSVALTRADDSVTVRTCPIIPDLTKVYGKSPEQTYISVVPTVVAKENPVVYILSPTPGTFKLMNPQGQLVQQGAYMPDEKGTYPVQLPQTSGVYVFHLVESTTAGTGNDLSRTVKVIVQ